MAQWNFLSCWKLDERLRSVKNCSHSVWNSWDICNGWDFQFAVCVFRATQAAHMDAILAPIMVDLGGGIPFAVFGTCGIAGGLRVIYLPETLNRPLYDTMDGLQEAEANYCIVA